MPSRVGLPSQSRVATLDVLEGKGSVSRLLETLDQLEAESLGIGGARALASTCARSSRCSVDLTRERNHCYR